MKESELFSYVVVDIECAVGVACDHVEECTWNTFGGSPIWESRVLWEFDGTREFGCCTCRMFRGNCLREVCVGIGEQIIV